MGNKAMKKGNWNWAGIGTAAFLGFIALALIASLGFIIKGFYINQEIDNRISGVCINWIGEGSEVYYPGARFRVLAQGLGSPTAIKLIQAGKTIEIIPLSAIKSVKNVEDREECQ